MYVTMKINITSVPQITNTSLLRRFKNTVHEIIFGTFEWVCLQ